MRDQAQRSMRMNLEDSREVKGRLSLVIRRKGQMVEEWGENLVVDDGRNALAKLLGGQTGYQINRVALGSDGSDPVSGDTLANAFLDTFLKNVSAVSYPATAQVCFDFIITEAEANGLAIRQFGLVCADGALFAHRTRGGKVIEKDSDLSIEGKWTIYF